VSGAAPRITLATAGHVDHGKTALVAALTGHDTDRLPEERARGISIALGFAPLDLDDGTRVSLVDVPGHERFVRHMVAGASGVDGYLLCVAADDGVMPQTREHMAVLELLGVVDGIVAVTKTDLADPSVAIAEVRELLGDAVPVIPMSARTGDGVPTLRSALSDLAARVGRRVGDGPARLYIDRSFSVAGAGTVVTGTLWGDGVETGERVRVHPGGHRGRVRSIEAHDRAVDHVAGGRVALGLAGVDRDRAPRGAVVVREGDGWRETMMVDVALTWDADAGGALRTRRQLQAFLGTTEAAATCVLLDADELAPGATGYAQLRFGVPLIAATGDRIVLRSAERRTVGGARVVDAHPSRHGRGTGAADRLRILDGGDARQILALRLAEAACDGLPLDGLDRAVLNEVDGRVLAGRAHARDRVDAAAASIMRLVAAGDVPRAAALAATGLRPDAAEEVVAGLIEEAALSEVAGRLTVGGRDVDPVHEEMLAALARHGTRATGLEALAEETGLSAGEAAAVLAALRERGRVVRAGDLWFAADAVESAVTRAVEQLRAAPMTIGELRDLWGVGRRHALALAAHMDAGGITLRRGDVRVLRRSARLP